MVNPVPGYSITTPFGRRGQYWSCLANSQGGIHTGADYAAPSGTQIVAPIDGQIRWRNYGSAFGPYSFAISPDDDQPFGPGEVFFAHTLDRPPNASYVKAGQPIARVGAKGNATGAHLHIEWMPNSKGRWACGLHEDPNASNGPIKWQANGGTPPPSSSWMFPSGHKVYAKYLKVDGHEQNADRESDSIKALQEMLNRHSMPGGTNLPITGKYWTGTDAEVRLCQSLHIPPADPEMASYVGPGQFDHLKKSTGAPYVFVADDSPTTPPPDSGWDGQWHVPAATASLRDEVNAEWPNRDTSSDGTIGDAAHSKSQSEHNPVGHPYGPEFGTKGAVHAIDITANGIDPQRVLEAVIGDSRVWYVIYDHHIYSKTYDWAKRAYTGSNPHTTHLHISLAADDQESAVINENNADTWGIQGYPTEPVPPDPEPVPPVDPPTDSFLTRAEFNEWRKRIEDVWMS